MKECNTCKQNLDDSMFSRTSNIYKGLRGLGLRPSCKKCSAIKAAEWNKKNKEKVVARDKSRWLEKKEQMLKVRAVWVSKNKEKMAEYMRKWRIKNKENELAIAKKSRSKRVDAIRVLRNARRAIEKQAFPKWANKFFMSEAYSLARERSKDMKIKWEVDHIVPLNSKLVCGLHSHTNIQVIPRCINKSKSNKTWPNMPMENK
ncbi:MAG: hypothetical protein CTY14_02125 [Methylotenera sp.]|nr:MAG: hypothetical protein CTY14_02125 [Methylotenera sp.]